MKLLRLALAALILAWLSGTTAVSASSYSTDQSDLWWADPPGSENGWGFQIVQRGSVIFLTMFVYGTAGTPTWYVATMEPSPPGSLVWTGDLYTTTGSWFGAVPYNPALFTFRKVGTITWAPATVTSGALNYVVDGVAVTKNVVRQTLVLDDFSGTYLGAFHNTTTDCSNSANNVPPSNDPSVTISVTQSGQVISIALSHPGFAWSITISGTLTQDGQFGAVSGTYTSSAGEIGDANVSVMNVQTNSLTANFSLMSTNDGCQNVGYLSGMRAR